eukprot:365326-Chlamydomonas_euryale.AAC.23
MGSVEATDGTECDQVRPRFAGVASCCHQLVLVSPMNLQSLIPGYEGTTHQAGKASSMSSVFTPTLPCSDPACARAMHRASSMSTECARMLSVSEFVSAGSDGALQVWNQLRKRPVSVVAGAHGGGSRA